MSWSKHPKFAQIINKAERQKTKTMKQYSYGRKKEELVAQRLRNSGAKVTKSPASKGPSDLVAKFPTKTWYIQVKAARGGKPAMPSGRDIGRLKSQATRSSATPVIALVKGRKVKYSSARDGRELSPK